jgi:hypothetical protein
MWRRRRFERLNEAQLSTAAKVRVHLGALGGAVPELSLDGSDRLTARSRLAGHRVATDLVVREQG